ncbi:MAG: hypothetical protein SXA11_10360 [Cyanobacteriota bacterium]|nr:hypothetical protein [Cyanobacteriota bacterium]
MTSTQITEQNNSKSLALKLISVVGLTVFAGLYATSWQRSLTKHYAEQEKPATKVAVATPSVAQEQQTSSSSTTTATTAATAPVGETAPVTSAPVAPVTSAPVVVETAPQIAPEITDTTTINSLNGELYQQIDTTWRQIPTFSESLVYKVKVTKEGSIAEYEHINKAASDYIQETPLPNLSSFASEQVSSVPTAEFLVVLAPTGTLQVSPWVGE